MSIDFLPQVLLHCYALDGITGHLFYPSGLHSLTDPEDYKIMHEISYSTGLRRRPDFALIPLECLTITI